MPNSNFDPGRILPLFRLPTNIPASMDYQRDRRNRRWWASPNRNVFLAAGIMLTVLALIVIVTSYFFASGPLATLLLSGHKDGSRAMATNMHERRFESWKDRFRKQRGYRHPAILDRKYQLSKKISERWARQWAKLEQRWSRLRHGNQAAENPGDEELGAELGVLRNEAAANAPKDETQAVVLPVDQTPAPQSNATPSSADLTQNKALQRSFSGPSSRTIRKPNSKAHSRVNFKTDTKANFKTNSSAKFKLKRNANVKLKKNANVKLKRNANFKTNRNASINTDRNANVRVDFVANFVTSNASFKVIGNLNIMGTGNANSQVSSNTSTKANNVADTKASSRASSRINTKTMTRSRRRMEGL
ncbi:hypothetical protein TGAMA5MH_06468 [Trichoderma gamsii]|uniref:Transmembrane protein n=1 Tax=Trichoderma gamsii TaxID=398673 RepID=A0A2K0T7Q8_9HYPO|nr:hypothetical protein TGAMA5MH_06468 [Trichoderma gamsii]